MTAMFFCLFEEGFAVMISRFTLLIQRFFARFCALILRLYFEEILVRGQDHCPHEGPLILAANHPNMLLDPIVIATNFPSTSSPFAFWAKSTLFKGFQVSMQVVEGDFFHFHSLKKRARF